MSQSIWLKDGVSKFPIKQPMVGQGEFYNIFREYLADIKQAPMTRIFPLIAKWGIGKSRIAYELISEVIGIEKGWIIRDKQGQPEEVRLLKPDFEDGILPVYIRYEHMNAETLFGDNWVGYGAYTAMKCLADEAPDGKKIQGSIIKTLQDALLPKGFSPSKLGRIIEIKKHKPEDLLRNINQLNDLVRRGMTYLKEIGLEHLMVIVDEVESEYELYRDGLNNEDEERKRKLDGQAIRVITSAIKHEDSRAAHPNISFLLLCSPAIGDQIKALEALDRRGEMLEMHQNPYSDITDFVSDMQGKGLLRNYPQGLVEAVYTIAGGNFGWLNVAMAYCDQYLDSQANASAGEVLESRLESVSRFKNHLIDDSQLYYIQSENTEAKLPLIRRALLQQLPYSKESYSEDDQKVLLRAKNNDGIYLFKEFVAISLSHNELGYHLGQSRYANEGDHIFKNKSTGETFNLDVLLRSLATFSITAPNGYYIVGRDKETFVEQVRMLYPKEEAEHAAYLLFDLIKKKIEEMIDTS
ncbi:hypothetical protein V7156_11950, partial [Priestia megaterium]|uniref:hypothetical protein n=1 Tax=Priestia megaterium TaxID=1404 RepID=UPI00300B269E